MDVDMKLTGRQVYILLNALEDYQYYLKENLYRGEENDHWYSEQLEETNTLLDALQDKRRKLT